MRGIESPSPVGGARSQGGGHKVNTDLSEGSALWVSPSALCSCARQSCRPVPSKRKKEIGHPKLGLVEDKHVPTFAGFCKSEGEGARRGEGWAQGLG